MKQLSGFIDLFKNLVPYIGKYTADKCTSVTSDGGNFMWHGMTGYQWYNQTIPDIEKTIRELTRIVKSKNEMIMLLTEMISQFDWSHMYSDDSRPSKVQNERNCVFNECIKLCPEDVKEVVYQEFITRYLKFAVNPRNPISYDEFIKGIRV